MNTLPCTRVILVIFAVLILDVFLILSGCSKSGSDGAAGPAGLTGPSGVEIYSIVANPSAIRPGASTALSVSAGDGVNSALTYSWQADAGTLSSNSTSSVIWTAPATVGSYMVSVEVTNAAGLKSRGYASILVSVSPAGPIITSVNPAEAKTGDPIQITGAGFGSTQGASSISIGSAPTSTVISWSDTAITAIVPASATTGPVIVSEAGINSSPGHIVILFSSENPVNTPISIATNSQNVPAMISDGSGGAIIVWTDLRNGNWDIFAQRVNSSGMALWAADGVAISTAAGTQQFPSLVSDGAGGAIIAWEDIRSGDTDIYAQRVSGSGVVQWTTNGVPVCVAAQTQQFPAIISDGMGGVIIVWTDFRNGVANKVYAQRLNNAGVALWATDGVAISTAPVEQLYPYPIEDGSGGAIIEWVNNIFSGNGGIFAQRIDSHGAAQWTADGITIYSAAGRRYNSTMIPDGAGGIIMAWQDYRAGATSRIYAQRVNSAGVLQWNVNGVPLNSTTSNQEMARITMDGSGGAIITWEDDRSGNFDIYIQRISGSGLLLWNPEGIDITTAVANHQVVPSLISDRAGGAIIAWTDDRNGNYDIYAQHVNSRGESLWTPLGVAISVTSGSQDFQSIVSDGAGNAIIVWRDARNGVYDIYAQGISASGRQ